MNLIPIPFYSCLIEVNASVTRLTPLGFFSPWHSTTINSILLIAFDIDTFKTNLRFNTDKAYLGPISKPQHKHNIQFRIAYLPTKNKMQHFTFHPVLMKQLLYFRCNIEKRKQYRGLYWRIDNKNSINSTKNNNKINNPEKIFC